METPTQPVVPQHADNCVIGSASTWIRFQHQPYMYAAIAGPDQSLGQRSVAEIIGAPIDAAASRRGIHISLKEVAELSRRQIRSAELEWAYKRGS